MCPMYVWEVVYMTRLMRIHFVVTRHYQPEWNSATTASRRIASHRANSGVGKLPSYFSDAPAFAAVAAQQFWKSDRWYDGNITSRAVVLLHWRKKEILNAQNPRQHILPNE